MQKIALVIFFSIVINFTSHAQENDLNGTVIHYEYASGGQVEAYFKDQNYYFHWTSGPYKGIKGSAPYQLYKRSNKKYVVNFYVEAHSSYVTLFFDFKKNKMIGAAIIQRNGEVLKSIEEAAITYKSKS